MVVALVVGTVVLVTLNVLVYTLFHTNPEVPRVYELLVIGSMLLLTSAANVMVFVGALPSTTLPSNVILPVACKLPFTVTATFDDGVPTGLDVLYVMEPVFVTVFTPLVSVR